MHVDHANVMLGPRSISERVDFHMFRHDRDGGEDDGRSTIPQFARGVEALHVLELGEEGFACSAGGVEEAGGVEPMTCSRG